MRPSNIGSTSEVRSIFLLTFVLFSCASAFAQKTHVYVTDTGSKYHLSSCRYLRLSKIKTTLDSAASTGYTACKVCKPPVKTNDTKVIQKPTPSPVEDRPKSPPFTSQRCHATTQKGTRCKRITRNTSGKCWQHE